MKNNLFDPNYIFRLYSAKISGYRNFVYKTFSNCSISQTQDRNISVATLLSMTNVQFKYVWMKSTNGAKKMNKLFENSLLNPMSMIMMHWKVSSENHEYNSLQIGHCLSCLLLQSHVLDPNIFALFLFRIKICHHCLI